MNVAFFKRAQKKARYPVSLISSKISSLCIPSLFHNNLKLWSYLVGVGHHAIVEAAVQNPELEFFLYFSKECIYFFSPNISNNLLKMVKANS